jgi:hypothetical protein
MITTRCAHALPIGATVFRSPRQGDTVYWKIADDLWDDGYGEYGNQLSNSEMDGLLSRGGEYAVVDLGLVTETVAGWDVEEDDYLLITLDFARELKDLDGDDRGSFFRDDSSQQLWRVAGWIYHAEESSELVLDAPVGQMNLINRLYRGHADGDQDAGPLHLSVLGDDVFEVVQPGQRHETWSYEWRDWFEAIPPRAL